MIRRGIRLYPRRNKTPYKFGFSPTYSYLCAHYVLIKLTDEKPLPKMLPGQFVEVRVDGSPATFLRRPISINYVDEAQNELWLLVATVGEGFCPWAMVLRPRKTVRKCC